MDAICVRYIDESGHMRPFKVGINCDKIQLTEEHSEYGILNVIEVFREGEIIFMSTLQKVENIFFNDPGNGDFVGEKND